MHSAELCQATDGEAPTAIPPQLPEATNMFAKFYQHYHHHHYQAERYDITMHLTSDLLDVKCHHHLIILSH